MFSQSRADQLFSPVNILRVQNPLTPDKVPARGGWCRAWSRAGFGGALPVAWDAQHALWAAAWAMAGPWAGFPLAGVSAPVCWWEIERCVWPQVTESVHRSNCGANIPIGNSQLSFHLTPNLQMCRLRRLKWFFFFVQCIVKDSFLTAFVEVPSQSVLVLGLTDVWQVIRCSEMWRRQ